MEMYVLTLALSCRDKTVSLAENCPLSISLRWVTAPTRALQLVWLKYYQEENIINDNSSMECKNSAWCNHCYRETFKRHSPSGSNTEKVWNQHHYSQQHSPGQWKLLHRRRRRLHLLEGFTWNRTKNTWSWVCHQDQFNEYTPRISSRNFRMHQVPQVATYQKKICKTNKLICSHSPLSQRNKRPIP